MRVLVTGGTGTVGTELVARLLDHDCEVRVLTRSPTGGNGRVARNPGVEYVSGDLAEPASLEDAFEETDRAYLLTPLHPQEVELGRAGVQAAKEAGVGRLVFQSIHQVHDYPEPPHFASKIEIEKEVKESGLPWSFICPASFYQNDLRLKDAILRHGVYPQPFGNSGVARVDVRDVADAAVAALLDPGHEGKSHPVVGPDVLTAQEMAATWSRHLGREIRYPGDDLDAWSAQARTVIPAWLVDDLTVMYRVFQEGGFVSDEKDVDLTRAIVGHDPRSFEAFVAETAKEWGF